MYLPVLVLIILHQPLSSAALQAVSVSSLLCEHLSNPLGIDSSRPRLSWGIVGSVRGIQQKTYHIRVGGQGVPDGSVWDSGVVASPSSSNVRYSGPALVSGSKYWWSVTVTVSVLGESDGAGPHTYESETATFSMGLLTRDAWGGKFIGMAQVDGTTGPAPWFRKAFALHALRNSSAMLYVASVGFCEVFVNGEPVTEAVLMPSISYLPKRILYRTYDVTRLLRPGKNAIGLWASAGWATYADMDNTYTNLDQIAPLLLAELRIDNKPVVVTDSDWKCHASTIRHIGGKWGDHGFGGDALDDRASIPGWNSPAFDDAGWLYATVYNTYLQGRGISADVMESTVKHSCVPAIRVTSHGGKHIIEMQELYTGWFEVSGLHGPPNSTVEFQVSTTKGIDMEHNMANSFTFGPSGEGVFSMKFSYHEIHFITVTGLSHELQLSDVVGFRLMSNLTRTGSFRCSSPLIGRIYETTVNNYQGLTVGGQTVDCPHRERRGYGGDGHTSYQFALQNFGVGAYFNKWTRDFADVQEPNGHVPHTAPTVSGGGGPAWSGFVVTNPWQTYLTYGDTAILDNMYPTMVRQLAFFANHTQADGLLHPWSSAGFDFLGDWLTPHGNEFTPTSPENILFNTCYYRYITALTARIARILGKAEDAAHYQASAEKLSDAVNQAFHNRTSGLYIDALQTHLVMPLASGVVEPASLAKTMSKLEYSIRVLQKGHLDTGLTGTYFMTKLLTEQARNDLVFTFANQTSYPSYGYFLDQGFTTWPEDWNLSHDVSNKSGLSKLHGCYNGIGLWFIQGIAGIEVDASDAALPIRIRAGVESGDITWAAGSRYALTGMAQSEWALSEKGFLHNVTIPGNTAARVMIPAAREDDVQEGGVPIGSAKGISMLRMTTLNKIRYVALKVYSGRYSFTSSWTRTVTTSNAEIFA